MSDFPSGKYRTIYIDPTYFKLQEERFNEYTAQQNIFLMESE